MGTLSTEALAELLFGVRQYVDNPKNPYVIDRAQMPWHAMLQRMKVTKPFINNEISILYKSEADDLDMQDWYGMDRLGFQEMRTGFDLKFSGTQHHMGLRFPHQELKDQGFIIRPNEARSQNFTSSISKADALRLFDTLREKIESALDRWNILIDERYLHNVSGAATAPTALSDLISKTPTVGTYGGRDRSDPKMQNQVDLATTSSTFRKDMNRLFRECARYNRGFKGAGVDVIMASGGWIDRYSDALDAQNVDFNTGINGPGPVDLGIPDTAWKFNGKAVFHNPTMDAMAEKTGDASWNRRAYLLNTKTWVFAAAPSEDRTITFPFDPAEFRVTHGSIDGRYALYCINPRSNAVHEFAT